MPYFGGKRLVGITKDQIVAFITHRQEQGIVATKGPKKGERIADVSNAEVNRELQVLKRIFNLAIESGRIAVKPHIPMLREAPARSGFFDRRQVELSEHVAMKLSGHLTPSVFRRYDIVSEGDLKAAARKLDAAMTGIGAQAAR